MEKKIYDLKNYLVKDENGNIKCTIQPKDYHLIMSLEDLPGEEWRRIKGCSLYSVSNMGRVRAESYEKWYSDSRRFQFYPTHIMAQGKNGNYLIVSLVNDMGNKKSYRVNRLVLEAFTDNPQNLPDSGLDLSEIICNVYVPSGAKKQGEKAYATIAKMGFILNGKRFVRLYSGSGQIRRNTVFGLRVSNHFSQA